MRRWHHGHSLGTGILGGLIIARRPELVYAAGLVSGVLIMEIRQVARWIALALEGSRRRHVKRVVAATVQNRRTPSGDEIPY